MGRFGGGVDSHGVVVPRIGSTGFRRGSCPSFTDAIEVVGGLSRLEVDRIVVDTETQTTFVCGLRGGRVGSGVWLCQLSS